VPTAPSQKVTYVLEMSVKYTSVDEARREAPNEIAAHLARSTEFHECGELLMAGAFLEEDEDGLRTMGVITSREAAEAFARGDPFVGLGIVDEWRVREWANMLAR
jgi:uncharacterized protein YciI